MSFALSLQLNQRNGGQSGVRIDPITKSSGHKHMCAAKCATKRITLKKPKCLQQLLRILEKTRHKV